MTLIVETNFILHIALRQEQAEPAETLLTRAEAGSIRLAMPASAISEAVSLVTYRRRDRIRQVDQLDPLLQELQRSSPHTALSTSLQALVKSVGQTGVADIDFARSVIDRCVQVADLLPLDVQAWSIAKAAVTRFNLELGDAMIYGAATRYLQTTKLPTSVFCSTDSAAFSSRDIRQELKSMGCHVIGKFEDVIAYLDSRPDPSKAA